MRNRIVKIVSFLFCLLGKRPTACVTCGGWECGLPVETEKTQSQKTAEKRAAYPPSSARCVGRRKHVAFITVYSNHSIPYFRDIFLCMPSSRVFASSAALSSSKKSYMPPGITIADYLQDTIKGLYRAWRI